jgi:hypothetical protein
MIVVFKTGAPPKSVADPDPDAVRRPSDISAIESLPVFDIFDNNYRI